MMSQMLGYRPLGQFTFSRFFQCWRTCATCELIEFEFYKSKWEPAAPLYYGMLSILSSKQKNLKPLHPSPPKPG